MCKPLIIPRPSQVGFPPLRRGRSGAVFGEPLHQPDRPGAEPRVHPDVLEDLVRPFVCHRLGLAQRRDLRGSLSWSDDS